MIEMRAGAVPHSRALRAVKKLLRCGDLDEEYRCAGTPKDYLMKKVEFILV